jgi:hypothetical protein
MKQYVVFMRKNMTFHGRPNYKFLGLEVEQPFEIGDVCVLEDIGGFTFLTKVGSAVNCAFSLGFRPHALKDISEDEVLIYKIAKESK